MLGLLVMRESLNFRQTRCCSEEMNRAALGRARWAE